MHAEQTIGTETRTRASGPPQAGARRRRRSPTRWDKLRGVGASAVGNRLLSVSVVVSALALGGAHPGLAIACAALVLLASGLVVLAETRSDVPRPVLVIWALALYSGLQSIPLPLAVVGVISPNTADVWARSLRATGEAVRWGSLSLEPGASSVECVKWLAYGAAFWAASTISKQRGIRWSMRTMMVSGVIIALVTLAHGLSDTSRVLGVYEPNFGPSRWHIGPFLNPNNLSGYLNLAVLCSLGLVVVSRSAAERLASAGFAAVSMGIAGVSGSRSGTPLLLGGIALLGLLTFRVREAGPWRQNVTWKLTTWPVVVGATLALLGSSWVTASELSDTSLEKLKIPAAAWPMIRDFPLTGVGRGSFEAAFQAYLLGEGGVVHSHPENLVVQWVSEWGTPIAVGAMLTLIWLFARTRLGVTSNPGKGAIAIGVGLLLAQNFVDLSLELFAPGLAASLLLGSLWGARGITVERRSTDVWPRSAQISAGVVAVLALALGTRGSEPVGRARQRLDALYDATRFKTQAAVNALESELRAAIRKHPADPYFARLGALVALRKGDHATAMRWAQRALERSATEGRIHLILAHILHARGKASQALLELRLAVENAPGLAAPAGLLAADWAPSCSEASAAAPRNRSGAPVLVRVAHVQIGKRRLVDALDCLERAVALDETASTRALLAQTLFDSYAERGCAGPQRANCAERITVQARALDRLERPLEAALVRGRLAVIEGRFDAAIGVYRQTCPKQRGEDRVRCLTQWIEAAQAAPLAPAELLDISEHLTRVPCQDDACAPMLARLGEAYTAVGDAGGAVIALERAARLRSRPESWIRYARAARAAGQFGRAVTALARAEAAADTEQQRIIQVERQELLRESLNWSAGRP